MYIPHSGIPIVLHPRQHDARSVAAIAAASVCASVCNALLLKPSERRHNLQDSASVCNDNENNRNVVLIVGDQKHGWLSSDEKVSSVTMLTVHCHHTHPHIHTYRQCPAWMLQGPGIRNPVLSQWRKSVVQQGGGVMMMRCATVFKLHGVSSFNIRKLRVAHFSRVVELFFVLNKPPTGSGSNRDFSL
jgi:hypothetical protein